MQTKITQKFELIKLIIQNQLCNKYLIKSVEVNKPNI